MLIREGSIKGEDSEGLGQFTNNNMVDLPGLVTLLLSKNILIINEMKRQHKKNEKNTSIRKQEEYVY